MRAFPSRQSLLMAVVVVLSCVDAHRLHSQTNHYSTDLLTAVRRAAAVVPGDAPVSVRVATLNPFRYPLASLVESVSADTILAGYTVFQIRFPRGWIIVDAALDREFVGNSTSFSDSAYGVIQDALRDARLAVVTHEHHDHIGGVLRSPFLAQVQAHTLLTTSQVRSLLARPDHPLIRIDSAAAAKYLTLDYEPLIPIAPGVVLIKAPGHSPGSQLVYVRQASGAEIVLAGDVAWHMAGIETQRHKPAASTADFGGEDRQAVAKELRWLRDIAGPQTTVVVAHDLSWINSLITRGLLVSGFDLRNP